MMVFYVYIRRLMRFRIHSFNDVSLQTPGDLSMHEVTCGQLFSSAVD